MVSPDRGGNRSGERACLAPAIPSRDRPAAAGHSCPVTRDMPMPATTDLDHTDDDNRAVGEGGVDWRGPVVETIREQAELADILPELLEYVTCGDDIDPRHVQELIDQDPVESPVRRQQRPPPPHGARTARAQLRRHFAKMQSLFKKSRSGCARIVLAGKWTGETPSIEMARQVAFWKPLFETQV